MKHTRKWFKRIAILLLFTVYLSFGFPTLSVVTTYRVKDQVLQLGAAKAQAETNLPKTEAEKFSLILSENYQQIDESLAKKDVKELKAAVKEAQRTIDSSKTAVEKEFTEHKEKIKKFDTASERLEEYEKDFDHKLSQVAKHLDELETMLPSSSLKDSEIQKLEEKLSEVQQMLSPEAPHYPTGNTLPNRDLSLNGSEPATEDAVKPAYLTSSDMESVQAVEEDLAETVEAPFSEDIQKLSDSLEDSALAIYEYVRNTIKFEPYLGSRKGAEGTLQQLSGNDVDQASLLISLLRYKGIPARYVSGTVEVPIEQVTNWVGVEDPKQAVKTLGSLGIPVRAMISGGGIAAVQMEHTWVEAFVPYEDYRGAGAQKGEKIWVPLDPSFKQNVYKEGLKLEEIAGIDKEALLNLTQNSGDESGDMRTVTNVDANAIQQDILQAMTELEKYIQENGLEDAKLSEVLGGWEITKQQLGVLPLTLPYKTIAITNEFTSVPAEMKEIISFSIRGGSPFGFSFSGENDFFYQASAAELYGKRITLSWVPAAKEDEEIIAEYGGIFQTPAYMIQVIPVLKVDGKAAAVGKPVGMAYTQEFVMGFQAPGMNEEKVKNPVTAGAFYAVGLNYGKIASAELDEIKANFEELKQTATPDTMYTDEAIGEMLNAVVKAYFGQLDATRQLISEQYDVSANRLLSGAMTGYNLNVGYLFMSPAKVAPGGMYIDVDRNIASVVSKKGDKQDELAFMLATGSLESAMEHGIYEQFLGIPSVSTIKVLEEANNRGIPIYTVTKKNIADVLPKLNVSSMVKHDITNAVNQGRIVTIPEKELTYYDWQGTGYLVMDPKTGAAGYMISGGAAGGSTSFAVDMAALVGLIDNFIGLIAAVSLIASGTVFGVIFGLIFAIIAIYSIIQLFQLMYQYYIEGDSTAGDAIITEAILGLIAAMGGSIIAKLFPGLKGAVDDLYNAVKQRIANKELADRIANEYSPELVTEIVKKSGTDSLPIAESLIKQLKDAGISKELIERAGKTEGVTGLENLQKLAAKGVDSVTITKLLDDGIHLETAVKLADRNISPADYPKYWVTNGTEASALVKALDNGFSSDDMAKLAELDFKPSHLDGLGIKTSEDLKIHLEVWNFACNCFTAGTQVKTDNGTKPIEEVKVGDSVLAKNTDTNEMDYKLVDMVFTNEVDEIYHLQIGNERISTTADHPFWINGNEWRKAKDLKEGDLVETDHGEYVPINKIETIKAKTTVYNFSVQDFHTYYVSELGILVHNIDCINPSFYEGLVKGKRTPTSTSGSPSARLGDALQKAGINPPDAVAPINSWQAHHIVPEGAKYQAAVDARATLSKYGIDINSATNGVWLPNVPGYTKYTEPDWDGGMYVATHNGRHLNNYFDYVNNRLDETVEALEGESDEVIAEAIEETIQDIRHELLTAEIVLHRQR
nr:polymorphic toxin-type HINT domain-containing protein [Neobacillus sp. Marseille-Q6967]